MKTKMLLGAALVLSIGLISNNCASQTQNEISESCGLFFAEFGEGTSNNKYLEIYNPTNTFVNLNDFALVSNINGQDTASSFDNWIDFPLGATIAPLDVFLVVHPSADTLLLAQADMTLSGMSNGDDTFGLVLKFETDYELIDLIGDLGEAPTSGAWAVGGVANATKDHVMIRKSEVVHGNVQWPISAGTDGLSSEWVILGLDDWGDVGEHLCSNSCAVVEGCNDPVACNFLSTTTFPVTCTYPGCNDSAALNFNAMAGCSDGSCNYACPTDVNGDGQTSAEDLLLLLSEFGKLCP